MAIIHVDMDAFFASVEQRDNPELRGRPVAVGGRPESRGVVAAASYEARGFGVYSAMPMATAVKLCPGLVIVPTNHKRYKEVSEVIMEIFHSYTPLVEPLSLDEAFLDVRGSENLFGPPELIGTEIQRRIGEELQLSASVGIGPNKFVAKLASDYQKPAGFTVIPQEKVLEFLAALPVEKMWGTGLKTADKLKSIGVYTIGQLRELSQSFLEESFGKYGTVLYDFARGRDTRPVEPNREVKSVGREITFAEDIRDMAKLRQTLRWLAEKVGRSLRRDNTKCGSVTLKFKYPDHKLVTRTEGLQPTNLTGAIYATAVRLLDKHCKPPVRLIGVSCGKLTREQVITLFQDEQQVKEERITMALDKLKDRYGEEVVKVASLLEKQ
ncbi:DNA polymerase IV [Desulfocucumis palustris]|uniref:DNA polymerase IV n=1 Tax=Desulfocucumis palustris TaxID=1898651 RepID=A0A2L2XHP9_9FIRM|nr:DNA polymerase IV [Desulfocucumis palustris]GBF33401.1 DNA polymerase IV [Desulfocucumis palustris]